MRLWRIVDGIPSIADGLLVAAVPMLCLGVFVQVLDPVLNYFDPRGLTYLGYGLLFTIFGTLGGIGYTVFMSNQAKMKEEIKIPRLVFAFSAVPVILIFYSVIITALIPAIVHNDWRLGPISNGLGIALLILFSLLYVLVVKAALRYPSRTTAIAIWVSFSLSAVGLLAKGLLLFQKK